MYMNKENKQNNIQVLNAIIAQTELTPNANGNAFRFIINGDNWNTQFSGQIVTLNELNIIISTLGVTSWENLTGCPIRIMVEDNKIINIGNFIRTQWILDMSKEEEDNTKTEKVNDDNKNK